MSEAYLILENGAVFKGQAFGYDAETVGELVFTTAMAGYLETITDPCYCGQIVLQTFPLFGNYGVIPADFDSGKAQIKAYIVREWCQEPSNFRSEGELDTFLRQNEIPGLCGIDTRALTRILRDNGVMNAMISKTPVLSDEQRSNLRAYKCPTTAHQNPSASSIGIIGNQINLKNIAIWNFGAPQSQILNVVRHGLVGQIHGYGTTAAEICGSGKPEGIVLTDGLGNPAENFKIIDEIKKLLEFKVPILAFGLGHQMLAIACGAKTEKMAFGHRGANQPVRDMNTGRVFVTTQNHGYTVIPESLPKNAEMVFVNCNDNTCEGIEYRDFPALSIQFRPGDDADGDIFGRFISMIEGGAGYASK